MRNSHDSVSCESFPKTLKREEMYVNEYRDHDHLRANITEFIDNYYKRQRLHSVLGYKPPGEFELTATPAMTSQGASMSFSGMRRSFDPM